MYSLKLMQSSNLPNISPPARSKPLKEAVCWLLQMKRRVLRGVANPIWLCGNYYLGFYSDLSKWMVQYAET